MARCYWKSHVASADLRFKRSEKPTSMVLYAGAYSIRAYQCECVCVCVWLPGTRVGAQVPAQSVASPAGVAAHRAFERLLPGMQFDVAKQVSLLGEGGPTLSAVEWPLA